MKNFYYTSLVTSLFLGVSLIVFSAFSDSPVVFVLAVLSLLLNLFSLQKIKELRILSDTDGGAK